MTASRREVVIRLRPLLDLGLPVTAGYELAQHLGAPAVAQPPVLVAITGFGLDRIAARRFSAHQLRGAVE